LREALFIKNNIDSWKAVEQLIAENKQSLLSPDELATLYINLSDDFAFAKTNYPNSKATQYVNQLVVNLHQKIYKNKKEKSNRLVNFWKYELPLEVYKHKAKLLYSFIFFFVFVLIGAVSEANEKDFASIILGEGYVRMTKENIKKGDPMAVYKGEEESVMFLGITINNVRVSFNAFVAGIFISIGTVLILMLNGIMVGCFQYFFYEHGVLTESLLTIWIHGTLEISAIIIAGGAGLVLGNSILFPKTYSRMVSFRAGVKSGLKIVTGLVPVFITAGFLEGYVTRHTEMPIYASLLIIFGSLAYIIWYFIIYPIKINTKYSKTIEQ